MSVADSITNALLRFGRPMTLRRKSWSGDIVTFEDVQIYGVTEGALSEESVDGVVPAGEATVTFSNAQIATAGWPGPPDKLDEIIIDDGQTRTIRAVETKFLGTQVLVFVAKILSLNYDRMIRLERFSVSGLDELGVENGDWHELATISASKVDLTGAEKVAIGQVVSVSMTRFRVPWDAEIASLDAKDRIISPTVGGDVYEIISVKEMMFKAGFEIVAKIIA